jgi:hypothetical protein
MNANEQKKIDDTFDVVYKDWIATVRQEGQPVNFDSSAIKENQIETTYIEFSLPVEWEEECLLMIDDWLEKKKNITNIAWFE